MFISPYHIQKGLYDVLKDNSDIIGGEVRKFFKNRTMHTFIGKRSSIPIKNMPCLEIIHEGFTPEWFASRTQKVTHNLMIKITVPVSKEENISQIIGHITTPVVSILTNPSLLQFQVQSEIRLEQPAPDDLNTVQADIAAGRALNNGQIGWRAPEFDESKKRRLLDSFVTGVTFNDAAGDGANFVQSNISWEGSILEPYLSDWKYFGGFLQSGYVQEFDFNS